MKRTWVVTGSLRELLRHLPPLLKQKIKKAFAEISENPEMGKPLVEELHGLRSCKLGKIRIIYRAEHASLILIAVGPRKTIYQKAALEIKQGSESKKG